ncbi:SRPBCC family protein [Longivirga aurantiaca]|uniref:SRPBCC family protein n=1 Tax=Longivirga aurantiaca TaxID=1837743 RepID=A0ABW1T4D6_9ACTN
MELQNSFVVPADMDTAWKTLQDVEFLAPCVPGATLTKSDGENFEGNVKVKLGPVSMTYGGTARFVSRDEATHTAVIEGTGKETKGTGTAKGLVTAVLVAEAPDRTRCDVVSELTITGKAAQFGRGVMQDVAGRIIDQFSANLAAQMTAAGAGAVAAAAAADGGGTEAAAAAPRATTPPPRPASEEAIDLLGTAGAPVLKRAIPIVIGAVVVIGLIIWLVKK